MPTLADYRRCAAEGMTVDEVAKKFKLARRYVLKVARERGLNLGGAKVRPLITAEVLDRVREMQAAGKTLRMIGAELGFERDSLSMALSRARKAAIEKAPTDRAPSSEAARSDDAHLPDGTSAVGIVATNDRFVLSLANAFGGNMVKAAEAAAAYRKEQARRETSVGAPVPVNRVNRIPYRIGESLLHAPNMEHPPT